MGVFLKGDAWYIDWYEGGRRRRKKTGAKNKTEAKRFLAQIKLAVTPRELGVFDHKLKCVRLVNEYLAWLKANRAPATYDWALGGLKCFFTRYPVRRVSKLTPELVRKFVDWRREAGISPGTINGNIRALKGCLNWGVDNNYLSANPLQKVKKVAGESPGRTRYLHDDEIAKLLKAAEGTVYHDIFFTFLKTGMRKKELVHLRWDDIDMKSRFIRIGGHRDENGAHNTKTYRERHVPMDDDLVAVIARQPRKPGCPYVFPTKDGKPRSNNVYTNLKRLAAKAGLEDVNVHTLRHTFASHLVMNGVDLTTVKELLGHSTIEMTMRYAHLANEHLRSAVETLKIPNFRDGAKVVAGPGFERTGS